MDECVHGMVPEWCALCREPQGGGAVTRRSSFGGGKTKREELDLLCDQLEIERLPIGEGSSLPRAVFDEARRRFDVPDGSMPEIAEAIANLAGLRWEPHFDSRGTLSGGGSTVTLDGLVQLNRAVAKLLAARRR